MIAPMLHAGVERIHMVTKPETEDEDVPFQMPERYHSNLKSGFHQPKVIPDTLGTDDLRSSPRDPKDVPQTPIAERRRDRS
jgi:hypothetical protein